MKPFMMVRTKPVHESVVIKTARGKKIPSVYCGQCDFWYDVIGSQDVFQFMEVHMEEKH